MRTLLIFRQAVSREDNTITFHIQFFPCAGHSNIKSFLFKRQSTLKLIQMPLHGMRETADTGVTQFALINVQERSYGVN